MKLTLEERQVVEWVADFVERQHGVVPGPWTERNGNDDSGLTVDVTFDNADPPPPFAVEVTRLRDDFEKNWTKPRLAQFEARVGALARARGWPGCMIALHQETSFNNDLAPAIGRMMEWMDAASLPALRPGSWSPGYVSMDLLARMQKVKDRDFAEECSDARLKGVNEVQRGSTPGVLVMWVDEFSDDRSLQRPLARAFGAKASGSLGVAKDRGYVTMLAVDVERADARNYISDGVKIRDFPAKVDHLFLFVRETLSGDLEAAFYANRSREGRRLKRLALAELPN
jgi:hypothetical protein